MPYLTIHFREALDKTWKELEKSDAKAPKACMKGYFGIEALNVEEIEY